MTPTELVLSRYTLPFTLMRFQHGICDDLAPLTGEGHYLDMGCVDADTEYLSPLGWKRIADYDGGQVMQFEPEPGLAFGSGKGRYVQPSNYIVKPCDMMIRLKTGYGIDQMLSPDHRVIYSDYRGAFKWTTAEKVAEAHSTLDQGFRGSFPTVFDYQSETEMPITDEILRLSVAVIADGHFGKAGKSYCIVRLKKPKKIERFRSLLLAVGIVFQEKEEEWDGCEGFVRFTFNDILVKKEFDEAFWTASKRQLEIIVDEVKYWDSHIDKRESGSVRFFTSVKDSANFIQFAFTAVGIRASMSCHFREREGRKDSTEYAVHAYKGRTLARLTGTKHGNDGVAYETPSDGRQYCFTVPSGALVLRRNGYVFVTGNCGKTVCSTVSALFQKIRFGNRCVVIMPPLLLKQWEVWLKKITPALSIVRYQGTPTQRQALSLDADFVLVGSQIFKKEYERFSSFFCDKEYSTIVDEATMICNIGTDTHQKVFDFTLGHYSMMLTGTPMNNPMDAYGLMKFVAPGVYRNKKQFENLHVADRDFFGNPCEFMNLELLAENMALNARRVLLADVNDEMPKVSYIPVDYELEPKHLKLYRKLAEEELLKLPDGGKIDATSSNRLIHCLNQIVVNYGYFAGDPSLNSNTVDLIEEKLSELGNGKLVVYAHYKMSISYLTEKLKKYGAVAVNSEVTSRQKEKNIERFISDPSCRLFIAQIRSAGYGLDGLQHVCNHALYVEPCQQPRDFHQSVARLARTGQTKAVQIYIAMATGTLQVRTFNNLLANDELVNTVIRNVADLRKAIYGE